MRLCSHHHWQSLELDWLSSPTSHAPDQCYAGKGRLKNESPGVVRSEAFPARKICRSWTIDMPHAQVRQPGRLGYPRPGPGAMVINLGRLPARRITRYQVKKSMVKPSCPVFLHMGQNAGGNGHGQYIIYPNTYLRFYVGLAREDRPCHERECVMEGSCGCVTWRR